MSKARKHQISLDACSLLPRCQPQREEMAPIRPWVGECWQRRNKVFYLTQQYPRNDELSAEDTVIDRIRPENKPGVGSAIPSPILARLNNEAK